MFELSAGIILLLCLLYFFPTLIAVIRGKSNTVAIFALNCFLGWTFVGWIVSLVWSLTNDNKQQPIIVNTNVSNDRVISPVLMPNPNVQEKSNVVETKIIPLLENPTVNSHQEKIQQLKQLKDLLEAGILTQEEFDYEKTKILSIQ